MSASAPVRRTRMAPAERRRQLVERATRIIAQVGFQGFSIAGLARECDISRAGILHHFSSAEEVLVEVLRHRDVLDIEALGGMTPAASAADTRRLLHALVERNAAQREIVRLYTVLSAESLQPEHPAHTYFADRVSGLRAQMSDLAPWHPDGDLLAVEVLAAMDGLQLNWLRDPTIDLVAVWDAIAVRIIPD